MPRETGWTRRDTRLACIGFGIGATLSCLASGMWYLLPLVWIGVRTVWRRSEKRPDATR